MRYEAVVCGGAAKHAVLAGQIDRQTVYVS
jgi:hypothetical protein